MKTIEAITEEQYEKFAETLETAIDSHEEYETTHTDAGDNYSHMPKEGGWCYYNGADRLKDYVSRVLEVELTDADLETLSDYVLDGFECVPGHIFSYETDSAFRVDSYPVGEIEGQYGLTDLARLLETDEETAREFADKAMGDNRFCLRRESDGGFLSYTNTDAVWIMEVKQDDLGEMLNWISDANRCAGGL